MHLFSGQGQLLGALKGYFVFRFEAEIVLFLENWYYVNHFRKFFHAKISEIELHGTNFSKTKNVRFEAEYKVTNLGNSFVILGNCFRVLDNYFGAVDTVLWFCASVFSLKLENKQKKHDFENLFYFVCGSFAFEQPFSGLVQLFSGFWQLFSGLGKRFRFR